jgi:chromate transporter
VPHPTFPEALRFWLKLGFISFGGPAGQIAIMHREVVEQRGWVGDRDFAQALNFCMILPGPEALQLAIYLGWRLHGTLGGVAAGLCFLLSASCWASRSSTCPSASSPASRRRSPD